MDKKTITEQMAEIDKQVTELKKLLNEYNQILTPNKIWLPGKGIVTLWETKHVKN